MSVREPADAVLERGSAVIGLLNPGRPPAILWTVGPVIVDPVEGMASGRPRANIIREGPEVIPVCVHGNAATAVIRMIGARAPSDAVPNAE